MSTPVLFQAFPPLSPDEYRALHDSIEQHGIQVPILVDVDGVVVDGHHRRKIAAELGISDVPMRVLDRTCTETEKRTLALTLNLDRRHLTRDERRAIVEASVKADPELSDREHARRTGVSHPTVAAVRSELTRRGDVEELSTRTDSLGRQQPVVKPDTRTPDEVVADLVQGWNDFAADHPLPPFDPGTGEVLDAEPVTGASKAYARPEPKARRRAITDTARDAGWDLRKAVERLERIASDDRFARNKDEVAAHLRHHLAHAIEVCQDLNDRLN